MTEIVKNRVLEKPRAALQKLADRIPLPLHYLINGVLIVVWAGDIITPDALPFLDEGLLTAAAYFYNNYIFRRTIAKIKARKALPGPGSGQP